MRDKDWQNLAAIIAVAAALVVGLTMLPFVVEGAEPLDINKVLDAGLAQFTLLTNVLVWAVAAFVAAAVLLAVVLMLVWGVRAVRPREEPTYVERSDPPIGRLD